MLLGGISVISLVVAAAVNLACGGFGSFMWLWLMPAAFAGSFLILAGLTFLFVLLVCRRVDLDVPQEEDNPFYRKLTNLVAEAAVTIVQARVHTRGMEQLPKDGRFLLVCNHLDNMDPVVLLHHFRKSQLAFISKRENSSMFVVGKLMHKILCQLINRENDREALKTILKCVGILKQDKASVAVFPEGYVSRDGLLQKFRGGVFKIAQKANVPIVVCTLQNTQYVFHNAKRLRPTHVQLHLLGVIPAEEIRGIPALQVAERVHAMMAEDLGPELVAKT